MLNEAEEPTAGAVWSDDKQENYRLNRRFDRMGRLVGDERMKRLKNAEVMVVGLGGVGSWAAEALVRSGVGAVTLIDFDEVCVTNFNRQMHAVLGAVGKKKVDVMADRLRTINPSCRIEARAVFYSPDNRAELFARRPDFVIDAIDHVTTKCHLLASCVAEKVPVVSSTGSGGRLDPTMIRVADMAATEFDVLAKAVRRILREKYGFPLAKGVPFGFPAVYSIEPPTEPEELKYDNGQGFKCVCPNKDNGVFNCDSRNLIMGNAGFVTGSFGFAAASVAVKHLIGKD